MSFKKFIPLLIVSFLFVFTCSAHAGGIKSGWLALNGISASGAEALKRQGVSIWEWGVYSHSHGEEDTIQFYDSLNSMIMAVNDGEIDEMIIPQVTAEYIININPDFMISCVGKSHGAYFVLGFKEGDGDALHKKFNEAIIGMKRDGTLEKLQQEYCRKPGIKEFEAVKFDTLEGAETVKAAVTGDIPPLDLTTADDQASGLSAAVIAEAARRLKVNIAVVNVDTGARTTALASGRADIVSWYEQIKDTKNQYDGARGVLYSEPYHEGDFFMHLKLKRSDTDAVSMATPQIAE